MLSMKSQINFIQPRGYQRRMFLVTVGIFLLAFGSGAFGFYSYGRFDGSSAKQQVAGTSTTQILPKEWLQKYFHIDDENDVAVGGASGDPDDDILSNFEEYTLGTDPTNPDTDGDGSYDGEEVAFNKNPNGDGPIQISQASAEEYISKLGPEYQQFSQENIKKQVEEFFQPNREIVLDLPDDKDLILTNDNDKAGFEKYYEDTKAVGAAEEQDIQKIQDGLFDLPQNDLQNFIDKLQAQKKILYQTPVPSEIVNIHKLKIAQINAGTKIFEIIRDNYRPDSDNQQFLSDFFYQSVAAQEAGTLELLAWKELFDKLKDQGGL